MLERRDRFSNRTLLWIIGTMSSFAYSLEESSVTVNKARSSQPWVRFSTDYVRCFCNLPQCVTTGYMCKSSSGGCFSTFLDHASEDYSGRHGCVELLTDTETRALCEVAEGQDTKLHKNKSLICCYHDMCNHVDSPQTKDLINETSLDDIQGYIDNHNAFIGNLQQPIDYSNSQVWFRAATIAVPVCGAVILFVLIALAVKILRSETQSPESDKLGFHSCDKSRKCYSERVQVPLLIQNEINTHHSGNKNETNAKLNLMHDKDIVLDMEKVTPKCSKTNLVDDSDKNIDIKIVNDALFK